MRKFEFVHKFRGKERREFRYGELDAVCFLSILLSHSHFTDIRVTECSDDSCVPESCCCPE